MGLELLNLIGSCPSQTCLGRMVMPPQIPTAGNASRFRWKRGFADLRLNLTLRSSTFSTDLTAAAISDAQVMALLANNVSYVKVTSSAVNGLPSLHFTPLRSLTEMLVK